MHFVVYTAFAWSSCTHNIYTVYLILHKWCAILNTFRVIMSDPVWPIKKPITILLGATSGKEITHFTFQKQYQCWLERDGLWEIPSEVCASLHPPSVPIKSFNGRHSHHCWGGKPRVCLELHWRKPWPSPSTRGSKFGSSIGAFVRFLSSRPLTYWRQRLRYVKQRHFKVFAPLGNKQRNKEIKSRKKRVSSQSSVKGPGRGMWGK